jgi:hypothetical protein
LGKQKTGGQERGEHEAGAKFCQHTNTIHYSALDWRAFSHLPILYNSMTASRAVFTNIASVREEALFAETETIRA